MRLTQGFFRPSTYGLLGLCVLLVPFLVYPLFCLLYRAITDKDGVFIGLANFSTYFTSPSLASSLAHSLSVGLGVTLITVTLAFLFAYSLTHVRIAGAKACGVLFLVPLFAPSLLPSIGLIYLLGAQGMVKSLLMGHDIYGALGIVLGSVLVFLPHAILILLTSLRNIDENLYRAAATLGAGPLRRFLTVTLPNTKYGIVSAAFVVFTLTITDFGIPKVIGGNYSMLATEIYAQVIGQQNFNMGATISVILLMPSLFSLALDTWARRGQNKDSPATLLHKEKAARHHVCFSIYAWALIISMAVPLLAVIWASFMAFWPYDLSFGLDHYAFEAAGYSWAPLLTSVGMSLCTAVGSVVFLLLGATLTVRTQAHPMVKFLYNLLLLMPLSLPGLVLGLAYIFAFNSGWLSALYGSFALLVINTMIHFSTVGHLTCISALGKINKNYESVGQSLGVQPWLTTLRVVFPLCRASLGDIFFYVFINAMTTVSAVIFLCSPQTTLAAISVIQMYDSGQLGSAAAMGTLIFGITVGCGVARAVFSSVKMRHFQEVPPTPDHVK